MAEKIRVGIIGCGNISSAYLEGMKPYTVLTLAACADKIPAKAEEQAHEYGVSRVCSVKELLSDPEIDLILNLTVPKAHAEINAAALKAGKHVYCEKPLAVDRTEAKNVLEIAARKNLRVGSAPDTFLGGGLQTCRKLIDDGWIGKPVAAAAFVASHGPEGWHPNPAFFYEKGGGPVLDVGPYYLTALVSLLGPVARTTGSTKISFPERLVTNEEQFGTHIPVEVPTHVAGVLDFTNGVVATLISSFDVWGHHLPFIEIYGSEGTLSLPDPNGFGGPVRLRRARSDEWATIPLTHSDQVRRGIGLADLATAIQQGRPHRASAEMAYHVLDVLLSFQEASEQGRHQRIQSTCTRPEPLAPGLLPGQLEAENLFLEQ